MNIYLFNFPKRPNSTKRPADLSAGTLYACTLIEDTSILTPRIEIKAPVNDIVYDKNYAYIPDLGRYYFITDIVYTIGLWEITLDVDVLATYKDTIGASTQYVLRSASEYNGEVIDSAYPANTDPDVEIVTSTSTIFGSNPQPYYIVGIIGGLGTFTGSPDISALYADAYNGSVVYYMLEPNQLYELVMSMLESVDLYQIDATEISKPLQRQLINPIQYIHSIKCVPVEPEYSSDFVAVNFFAGFNLIPIKSYTPPTPPPP